MIKSSIKIDRNASIASKSGYRIPRKIHAKIDACQKPTFMDQSDTSVRREGGPEGEEKRHSIDAKNVPSKKK